MTYFKIGDRVKVSPDNDNDGYNDFKKKILIVTKVSHDKFDHQGYDEGMTPEALYDFKDLRGKEIGCSLYDYELIRA